MKNQKTIVCPFENIEVFQMASMANAWKKWDGFLKKNVCRRFSTTIDP